MRSAISGLLAALALAGCGNWSNDDVAFVHALPTSQALKVALPASAGQALCAPPGPSEVWGWAKPTGDGLNALVDGLLAFVDLVRSVPPSTRSADARSWGPFDDAKHPGLEVRVRMSRTRDAAGVPTYGYVFEARPKGGTYQPVLEGSFRGETARTGQGEFALHFATLRALGMDDNPATDPTGDLTVQYDRSGDPRTVGLDITQAPQTATLASFDYGYAGYLSGRGFFHYAFTNAQGQQYVVDASFDAAGEGKATVTLLLSATSTFSFSECWDAAGCVTNVDDPLAGTPFFPSGVSKLCPGGVCPTGACPSL